MEQYPAGFYAVGEFYCAVGADRRVAEKVGAEYFRKFRPFRRNWSYKNVPITSVWWVWFFMQADKYKKVQTGWNGDEEIFLN